MLDLKVLFYRLDGRRDNTHASYAKVWSLSSGTVKFYTALQTVRHRLNIYTSSCAALALWCTELPKKDNFCNMHNLARRLLTVSLRDLLTGAWLSG